MHTDIVIYVAALFLVFITWAATFLTYRRKLVALKTELRISEGSWYHDGWEDAIAYVERTKITDDIINGRRTKI